MGLSRMRQKDLAHGLLQLFRQSGLVCVWQSQMGGNLRRGSLEETSQHPDNLQHGNTDPDLDRELRFASRQLSETEHASSKQKPLKRAGFRDGGSCDTGGTCLSNNNSDRKTKGTAGFKSS